jgi:hypothetical protein
VADYFEVDRVFEDIAKIFASQFAVSFYKVNNIKSPSRDEFRDLVVEFMKNVEYSLDRFPDTEEGVRFKEYCKKLLVKEIDLVKSGENKEVEKRYKYFTQYN